MDVKMPVNMPNMPTNWHKKHKASLSAGDRLADGMRNGMGSWAFVFTFIAFLGGWALLNSLALVKHWDEYPFILLNLFLSMLAALQGAILLIAAKRVDQLNAAMAEDDYKTNVEAKKELEELMELNRKQLHLIEKLVNELENKK